MTWQWSTKLIKMTIISFWFFANNNILYLDYMVVAKIYDVNFLGILGRNWTGWFSWKDWQTRPSGAKRARRISWSPGWPGTTAMLNCQSIVMICTVQWNTTSNDQPIIEPLCYYSVLILACTKAQLIISLFKELKATYQYGNIFVVLWRPD